MVKEYFYGLEALDERQFVVGALRGELTRRYQDLSTREAGLREELNIVTDELEIAGRHVGPAGVRLGGAASRGRSHSERTCRTV